MSSDVVKCPKDWFSVRETCRENKDMVCGGRAKKPARARREDYAEQRELKSLTVIGTGKLVAYSLSCLGSIFSDGSYVQLKHALLGLPYDLSVRRVGRSESL